MRRNWHMPKKSNSIYQIFRLCLKPNQLKSLLNIVWHLLLDMICLIVLVHMRRNGHMSEEHVPPLCSWEGRSGAGHPKSGRTRGIPFGAFARKELYLCRVGHFVQFRVRAAQQWHKNADFTLERGPIASSRTRRL